MPCAPEKFDLEKPSIKFAEVLLIRDGFFSNSLLSQVERSYLSSFSSL